MSSPTASTSRQWATILASIEAKEYYTAHQKLRTTVARLLSKAAAPSSTPLQPDATAGEDAEADAKTRDALWLLWNASKKLLEEGQVGSGNDLSLYLVETWKARGIACLDEERAKITQLIALTGPALSWRKSLTDAVFTWTVATGSGPAGDESIHAYLGETLAKERNFQLATLHLLTAPSIRDAAKTLADVLFQWSKLDPEGPAALGRYAARGVLSYLEGGSIQPAKIFLSQFLSLAISQDPSLLVVRFEYPPPSSTLATSGGVSTADEVLVTRLASLNYLQLAIKTCQAGQGEFVERSKTAKPSDSAAVAMGKGKGRTAWTGLVGKYEKDVAWLRAPEVKESTQELGNAYFGIKPPRPAGNMMADMLSGLFSGAGGPPAVGGVR